MDGKMMLQSGITKVGRARSIDFKLNAYRVVNKYMTPRTPIMRIDFFARDRSW